MERTERERIVDLVLEYANVRDAQKQSMEEKYPDINFGQLLDNKDFVQEMKARKKQWNANAQIASGGTGTHAMGGAGTNPADESVWIRGLSLFAWAFLVVGIISGIFSAWQLGNTFGVVDWHTGQTQMNGGIFFIVLIVSVSTTFLVTAVIMTYVDLCRNVAKNTKDTAEVKEILKNK